MTISRRTLGKLTTWSVLGGGSIGIFVWAMASALLCPDSSSQDWILVLMAYPLFFMVAYETDDLGHFVAALAVWLCMRQFTNMPPLLEHVKRSFRVRFFDPVTDQLSGYVSAFPLDVKSSRFQLAIIIGAGPAINLFVGTVCCALLSPVAVTFFSFPSDDQTAYWLHFIASFQFVIAIASMIPVHNGSFYTDGYLLLACLRGETPESESKRILKTLGTMMVNGTRPAAWNAALVERMLALRDGSPLNMNINLYAYYYALDCKQYAEAGVYLDLAAADYLFAAANNAEAIFIEKAYFEGFHRRNSNARAWFARVQEDTVIEQHTRLRAEAAVLFVEGYYAEAAARAEAALAAVPQSADLGGSLAEAECLQTLLIECRKCLIPNRAPDLPTLSEGDSHFPST